MNSQPTRVVGVALKTLCVTGAVLAVAVGIVCLASPATSQVRPHVVNVTQPRTANSVDSSFLLTCGHDAVARPATFDVLCSDGTDTLVQLDWSSWGGTTSTAAGRYVTRACTPRCAASVDTSYPVKVVADKHVIRDGVSSYQELRLTFTGGPPGVLGSVETWDLTLNWLTPVAGG